LDGIILCNKPSGITSNRIARTISKKFQIKVGNTGILDLAAEGLLILVIGKATKFTQYFQELNKEYISVGELGKETDTYDKNGEIVRESEINISEEKLIEIIKSFEGEISMVPPAFSSKKINGKRAYKYALKGEDIELKPINVNVEKIDVIEINLPFFKINVKCSSGTYIRTLIKEIGISCGCYAYMFSLKRTRIGNFSLLDSVDYDKLINFDEQELINSIIPIKESLYFFPELIIEKEEIKKFKNGQKIKIKDKIDDLKYIFDKTNLYKILDDESNLIGLATIESDNLIQPRIVI